MILDGAGDGGTEAAKKKVEKDDGYVRSYADDVDTLSVTFRSVLLSLIACVLGSTISAITLFRQSGSLNLSGSVIQILSYIIGTAWAKWLPSVPIDEGRVDQRRPLTKWQKVVHFVNPGPFTIKEHAVIAIVSSCRVNEVFNPFIVHKLYYEAENPLSPIDVIFCTIGTTLLGLSLAGLFSPILVDSPLAVWYELLPTINFMQMLHFDPASSKRFRLFWLLLLAVFCYEVLPLFIFPTLAAFSIPCLALRKGSNKSKGLKSTFTNLFGSANINEGLGLLALTFDWQYITTAPLVVPLQGLLPAWIGAALCIIFASSLYYANVFQAKTFPFLSTKMFLPNGKPYTIGSVLTQSVLDEAKIAAKGNPKLPITSAFKFFTQTASVGAMLTWTILFWGKDIYRSMKFGFKRNFRRSGSGTCSNARQQVSETGEIVIRSDDRSPDGLQGRWNKHIKALGAIRNWKRKGNLETSTVEERTKNENEGSAQLERAEETDAITLERREQPHEDDERRFSETDKRSMDTSHFEEPRSLEEECEHFIAMQRYQSIPILWYLFILAIAFTSGTVLCVRGNTTLKFTSYLVGVILGGFLSPVVGVLKARTGGTCYIGPIAKMVFGAIVQPGHPLATAYFSATCTAVMSQCLVLASHFKMGAYLRVPPRVVFTAILFGIAISAAIELPIMFAIVSRQRETLLSDTGTLMWSGIQFQLVNQEAFSWSLTRKIYGPDGYFFVPMGFLIGIGLSAAWFLLTKVVPRIGSFDLTKDFHMSILIFETGYPISHHTNGLFTRVLVGAFSCLYLKLRHARFYHRQLPVIGAALDGGVAFMVLLVSLAFGGMLARNAVKFPIWPGNPSKKSGVFPDHCPITGSAGGPE